MFKKSVSLYLALCQVVLSVPSALAADRPGEVTAERQLVETVLTLKGLGLSDQDLHNQVEASLKDYDGKAEAQGRDARLQQAFVDMRILSPQQARSFLEGTRAAEANLAAQNLPTPEAHGKALEAQLELFARINPVGAQFASCSVAWTVVGVGVVAAIVGLTIATDNPTCHADYNAGYSCSRQRCDTCRDSDGYSYDCNCYDYWSTCYPTVCDRPGYYPHRQEGNTVAIAGGVAAAVGLVMLLTNRAGCI